MIFRTYKFVAFEDGKSVSYPIQKADGDGENMFYNFDSVEYATSGVVASYSIDEDYLMNNNSTVNIAEETDAEAGQIIALIEDDGTYTLGVVNSVDNEKLTITFKQMNSLFDVDVLNPTRYQETDDEGNEVKVTYLYDAVDDTARFLATFFCSKSSDRYMRLPLQFDTRGGGYANETTKEFNVKGIWSYTGDTLNLLDWIQDLFNNYNVVITFSLEWATTGNYIEVHIEAKNTSSGMFKGNIKGLTVTHNEDTSATATVCSVLDSETKELLSTWYLLADNTVCEKETYNNAPAGTYADRVQPYSLVTADLEPEDDSTTYSDGTLWYGKDGATDKDIAESNLLYSDFNHYVQVKLYRDSPMFPTFNIGDMVQLILDVSEETTEEKAAEDYSKRVLPSIYTGLKFSSDSNEATLIFGKIRINYTDLIQMRVMKKIRS